jgi:predicted Zn finger-like uncharacterized protein
MSLATRCTACGTVFRVVQDQLRVSEGWVRCGRCQEVFNAREGLFDLDREGLVPARAAGDSAAAAAPPPAPAIAASSPAPTAAAGDELGASVSGHVPLEAATETAISIARFTSQPVDAGGAATQRDSAPAPLAGDTGEPASSSAFHPSSEPASSISDTADSAETSDETNGSDFADARFNTALLESDSVLDGTAVGASPAAAAAAATTVGDGVDVAVAEELSFLQQAEREALWQQPGVRRAMMMITGVLVVSLAVQVAVHFHDSIAARWPASHGTMELLCAMAGCEIEPPRRLEAISVDSSGLQRVGEADADGYRLSLSLRNSADHAVLPPTIELSLTDANGQLISRRVLAPSDFAFAPAALAPHGETPLQAVLLTGGERISGYTVEVFYP